MVFHTVLFKFKKGTSNDAIAKVMKSIGDLKSVVPGMTSFKWGPYSSAEGLNRGFGHGFVMTFDNAKSRDTYLTHPAHEKVKAEGLKIIDGGVEGVLAFDFEG